MDDREDLIHAAADRLSSAAATGRPCAPVRDLLGAEDVDLAYAVQRELTARQIQNGARVVGRKIGLTSAAVQRQLGVDQPDFGMLFDDMSCAEDREVPTGRLLQPRAEAEVAFVLGTDLDTDDPVEVRRAVAYAVAAIEIVDSRVAGWDITIVDTVADNASSGLYVLGAKQLTLAEFEPADVVMSLTLDDRVASEGTGRASLGDPLAALAWLARKAVELGDPLRAGQVVLSGALGPVVPVGPGSRVQVELSALGTVSATFGPAR